MGVLLLPGGKLCYFWASVDPSWGVAWKLPVSTGGWGDGEDKAILTPPHGYSKSVLQPGSWEQLQRPRCCRGAPALVGDHVVCIELVAPPSTVYRSIKYCSYLKDWESH